MHAYMRTYLSAMRESRASGDCAAATIRGLPKVQRSGLHNV